jgi:hypothetical protein
MEYMSLIFGLAIQIYYTLVMLCLIILQFARFL